MIFTPLISCSSGHIRSQFLTHSILFFPTIMLKQYSMLNVVNYCITGSILINFDDVETIRTKIFYDKQKLHMVAMCFRSSIMIIGCFLGQLPLQIYMVYAYICPSQTRVHEFTSTNFLLWIYLFRNEIKLKGKLLCKCTQNATHHHNVFFFFFQKGSERGLSPTGTNPLIMFCLFHILWSSHFLFQEGLIISIGCLINITISLLGLWLCDWRHWPACQNC